MAWTLKLLVACLLVAVGGCATLTDHHYEKTQRARAREAWRQHGSKCHNQVCEKDYAAGWKDGFYDIATGGKGCPPVVAPCKYWSPSQILEDCDSRRLAYYDGFQDGVACSLQYPQTHYLKLWSSCECPLPNCETRCAPCAPCAPALPAPCGVVFEGAEFLIEDNSYPIEPVLPADNSGRANVQHVEPPQEPAAEKPAATEKTKAEAVEPQKLEPVEAPKQDEPGTSVRYSEPLHLDTNELSTLGSSGYSFQP